MTASREPTGMPALVVPAASSGQIEAAVLERAREFIDGSVSWNTRRAYKSDYSLYQSWCELHGHPAMPTPPTTIIAYLIFLADSGKKVATIERHYATLSKAFRIAAIRPSPCEDPAVKQVLAGIRRKVGSPQNQKEAAIADIIRQMVAATREDDDWEYMSKVARLTRIRDRAMLLFGFAGAFRRSELMALQVEHLTFVKHGVRVLVPSSKTDQEHVGAIIGISFGRDTSFCPVRAMREWLEASKVTSGRIFRAIGAGGRIREPRGNPWQAGQMVGACVKRCAKMAGLDASIFAGHSLRSGFATQGFLIGKNDRQIMRHGRWRDLREMEKYIREVDLFRDNPTDGLL